MTQHEGLSTSNATHSVRWLLNLATHPAGQAWLGEDPTRFAAFFAALKPRIELSATLREALPSDKGSVNIRVRQEQMDAWRKSDDQPLRGRVSPRYLEAFWEGTLLAAWAQREPAAWEAELKQIVGKFSAGEGVHGQALSTYAQALKESPSLLEAPMPSHTREPVALFEVNLMLLSVMAHNFTREQIQILALSFCLAEDEAMRFLFEVVSENPRAHAELMPAILDMSAEDWGRLVDENGELASLHMVTFEPGTRRVMPMHAFWHGWLGSLHKDAKSAIERLVCPLKRVGNAGALGRLAPEDTQMVRKILDVDADHIVRGTNVLLYGARSIDKLGWVFDQAVACERTPYTLPSNVPDPVRPSVCYMAQRILHKIDDKGWLVLPQADTILTRTQRGTRQFLFMEIQFEDELPDNAREAVLLANNPVPSVWLVHSAESLSENNIGRFLYTCEIKAASRSERRVEIDQVLRPLQLSEEFINELSQHTRVSEQQLRSAVALCWRLLPPALQDAGNRAEREELVRRAIEQSQKALSRRQREDLRTPVTQYSLDLLNLQGAFGVQQIIQSLKRHGNGSLCFYGLPGTGKTQLAEHIAVALDKPILIKRASDILGMYVGENEKNIRKMFDEARDEDAVLLLDEADSFLRDRTMARAHWEVSTVNELLQGMERHRGVFICTTNLFRQLDTASLRRFTFKLEFCELDERQRWQMFVNETGIDPAHFDEATIDDWKMDLNAIRGLAPGDFATIQRQVRLMGEMMPPDMWLMSLRNEAKSKLREAGLNDGNTQTF